jgi:hypothetical protein
MLLAACRASERRCRASYAGVFSPPALRRRSTRRCRARPRRSTAPSNGSSNPTGILAAAGDPAAAEATERQVFEAWKKWYAEAIESVLEMPVAPSGPALRAKVERAAAKVRARQR